MPENDQGQRLRLLALMLKFGHELFSVDSLASAAAAAVNNAHELLPYSAASIFECTDGRIQLLAQFGVPESNEHSEQALEQRDYVKEWLKDPEHAGVPAEHPFRKMQQLPMPAAAEKSKVSFVWLADFAAEPAAGTDEVLKLMAASAGEALAYHRLCRPRRAQILRHMRKSTFWGLIGLLALATMFIRVPESTTTEFSVCAPKETTVYAWFDGAIESCLKKDGDRVKAGEVVVKYDVSQVAYRMALAKNQLAETKAELALVRQNAFANPDELGRVKLLELRCQGLQVSVDEAQWYEDHAEVRAPADGVVSLTDGDSARLENRAVRTGDELFRILGGEGFEAEIAVNERDASVLRGDLTAKLFLHTAPEKAIAVKVLRVSHNPQLNEQKVWAYRVRVAMDPQSVPADLRYGMRGIAKLQSGKVSLGYRMFKSGVLYLRGL